MINELIHYLGQGTQNPHSFTHFSQSLTEKMKAGMPSLHKDWQDRQHSLDNGLVQGSVTPTIQSMDRYCNQSTTAYLFPSNSGTIHTLIHSRKPKMQTHLFNLLVLVRVPFQGQGVLQGFYFSGITLQQRCIREHLIHYWFVLDCFSPWRKSGRSKG